MKKHYTYKFIRNRLFFAITGLLALPIILTTLNKQLFSRDVPAVLEAANAVIFAFCVQIPFNILKKFGLPVGRVGDYFGYAFPNAFGYTLIVFLDICVIFLFCIITAKVLSIFSNE